MRQYKPEWMKISYKMNDKSQEITRTIAEYSLNTVCVEANCPNLMECFAKKTATFLIMGKVCTRRCKFCNIETAKPLPLDSYEPIRVAKAVKKLRLNYVVITSVDRDDLPDGGAEHFARVIAEVKRYNPSTMIEVLIPDFHGDTLALDKIFSEGPDVINHNIETIEERFHEICPQCNFTTSLGILSYAKHKGFKAKSGFMVGLGEDDRQVMKLLKQLRTFGCDYITIGQYIQPTRNHTPVQRYVHPRQFADYKSYAENLGFTHVESGPFVRSSYYAEKLND